MGILDLRFLANFWRCHQCWLHTWGTIPTLNMITNYWETVIYIWDTHRKYMLSISLSHSWSNHEFLFRFQPFGEGVLQGMLCLAPWDHKPCDKETCHEQISNYINRLLNIYVQGTWCSIRRLSRNHWNGWRCLHQFLDHWILRRWWNLNQHLSAAALCREILDVVAAIHVLAQTHCAVAQSAGMGGKWVLVSLGPLIT